MMLCAGGIDACPKGRRLVSMKLLTGVLLGLALAAVAYWAQPQMTSTLALHPVSDNVFQSRVLRCGYAIVAPQLTRDPNTGQLGGPIYDIANLIADTMGWTLEWTEEVPFTTALEGLYTGRYDVFCTPLFARPNFMTRADFVGPFHYVPVNVYVRPDDEGRFTTRTALNDPAVRVGMIDGTIPQFIARTDFPRATTVNLPEMSDYAENMLLLTTGKADVTFVDAGVASSFLKQHPGAIVPVTAIGPLRVYPVVFAIKKGETPLLNTLNDVVTYLHDNGQVRAILDKYDASEQLFMRQAPRF